MKKYPRTFHLPFSPEVHSDDKVINPMYLKNFIGREVVISEKMDGENSCLKGDQGVFARSHQIQTKNPWTTLLKQHYYENLQNINKDIWYFMENLYAVHSIEYKELKEYFLMFGAYLSKDDLWASWHEVELLSTTINLKTPPVLFKGEFTSIKDIQKWMDSEIKKPSKYGKEREGFVIRVSGAFRGEDFHKNVAKYVRKGHVQTDEHWTKNWKKAELC